GFGSRQAGIMREKWLKNDVLRGVKTCKSLFIPVPFFGTPCFRSHISALPSQYVLSTGGGCDDINTLETKYGEVEYEESIETKYGEVEYEESTGTWHTGDGRYRYGSRICRDGIACRYGHAKWNADALDPGDKRRRQ
ncbi:MAG: hypothetical protein ACXQTD_09225, partial [Candidatus Syntropharchaeia archaeon]